MENPHNFIEISQFTEEEARKYLERLRWRDGNPICPHCESKEAYQLKAKTDSKHSVRKGVYKCKSCRKQFSVTIGTIFEGSHVPIKKWLMAFSLMCSPKKGISSHQIHRMLDVTYKSAWFITHRIRYAMNQEPFKDKLSGTIEADETYIGGKAHGKRGRGAENKMCVVSLIERNGDVRYKHIDRITGKKLKSYIKANVDKESIINTDEFPSYKGLDKEYIEHRVINHGNKEYVNGDIYTNTAEGYFSLLKRGINGTFHHVSKQHLHRYLSEFDFRYNARKICDALRFILALKCVNGKRLMYN